MFITIEGFLSNWGFESGSTQKVLDALTDGSLKQEVMPNDRTLGGIAWHLVTALPAIVGQTGLTFEAPAMDAPVPATAKEIADEYRKTSQALTDAVKSQWTDQTLAEMVNLFGQFEATKGTVLSLVINHQIHHRGQMTILMRQAGLIVPGVYGPSKEEWIQMGAEAPPAL